MTREEKEKRKLERRQKHYNRTHKKINGEIYKLCNKHHIYFPDEDLFLPLTNKYFYKNKSNYDGYNPYCIKCTIKKMYEWRSKHPEYLEKENKRTNGKYHNDPKYKQMIIENSNNRRNNGKMEEWQQNNKDKLREYALKHKNHNITKIEWESCKEYFNNSCAYCGLHINDHYRKYKGEMIHSDLHKEHVDNNGMNDLSNCIPSCLTCNTKKHTSILNDWYNENNPVYTKERYDKIIKWLTEDYKN